MRWKKIIIYQLKNILTWINVSKSIENYYNKKQIVNKVDRIYYLQDKWIVYRETKTNHWTWIINDNWKTIDWYSDSHSLTVNPNNKSYAFIAEKNNKSFVIDNYNKWNEYNSVSDLVFNADWTKLAYIAKKNNQYLIVENWIEWNRYDTVWVPQYSKDWKLLMYIAKKCEHTFAVINWKEEEKYEEIANFDFLNSFDGNYYYLWKKWWKWNYIRNWKVVNMFPILLGKKYKEVSYPHFYNYIPAEWDEFYRKIDKTKWKLYVPKENTYTNKNYSWDKIIYKNLEDLILNIEYEWYQNLIINWIEWKKYTRIYWENWGAIYLYKSNNSKKISYIANDTNQNLVIVENWVEVYKNKMTNEYIELELKYIQYYWDDLFYCLANKTLNNINCYKNNKKLFTIKDGKNFYIVKWNIYMINEENWKLFISKNWKKISNHYDYIDIEWTYINGPLVFSTRNNPNLHKINYILINNDKIINESESFSTDWFIHYNEYLGYNWSKFEITKEEDWKYYSKIIKQGSMEVVKHEIKIWIHENIENIYPIVKNKDIPAYIVDYKNWDSQIIINWLILQREDKSINEIEFSEDESYFATLSSIWSSEHESLVLYKNIYLTKDPNFNLSEYNLTEQEKNKWTKIAEQINNLSKDRKDIIIAKLLNIHQKTKSTKMKAFIDFIISWILENSNY